MLHYASLLPGNASRETMAKALSQAPQLAGFLKRYQWKTVEPEKCLYDFREIEADRAFLAERGKVLIPMIEDKTFTPVNPNPSYALTLDNGTGGYTAVRWDAETAQGLAELLAAIGASMGHKAGFGGIATQETAPGLSPSYLDETGYTAAGYGELYLELAYMLDTLGVPMYWHANYIPRGQDIIGSVLANAPENMLMGGPDCWPGDEKLIKNVYPYYRDSYRTNFVGMSVPSYEYPVKDLIIFARDTLQAETLFWVYVPQFVNRVAPVLKNYT